MIDLSLLPDGGMSWLDASGPGSHLVLSSRIRLARNLADHRFGPRVAPEERATIFAAVAEAAGSCPLLRGAATFRVDQLEAQDRQLMHERHLISRELAAVGTEAGVRPSSGLIVEGRTAVMVNEEDHLRLQELGSGVDLEATYARVRRVDAELGQRLAFAFHPEFGYLTSCPTNVGTGLRASVLIHLPGLVLTKEINKVLQGLTQVGLTYRGLYGEGSEVVGNFFQLSNQTTLGKSEEQLLGDLHKIVQRVMGFEESARQVLVRDAPGVLEDKVWRAFGLLRYARSLSFDETMNLMSGVRLGVGVGLIPNLSVYTLNKLLVFTQPAHLAADAGKTLDEEELRWRRANYVRAVLEAEVGRRPT